MMKLKNRPDIPEDIVHLLIDIEISYEDEGCEDCGTIDAKLHKKLRELLYPSKDECVRCGSKVVNDRCSDVTCPFSDCDQDDIKGWTGHPDMDRLVP